MKHAPNNLMHCLRALVDPARHETATDSILLARWVAERDDRAFAGLVWRHGPLVWRIARNVLPQQEDAEDAFQATFLVLARKAASLQRRHSLAGWLFHTAHRLALKSRTATARRLHRENQPERKAIADPLREISAREAQAVLSEELSWLSAVYREPLLLCLYEGSTQDEAARQLGCSLNTVKRRIERGRELLGQRLARRGLAPAGALALTLCSPSAAPALLIQQTITAAGQFGAGHALTTGAGGLAESVLRALLLKKLAVSFMAIFSLSGLMVAGGLAYLPAGNKFSPAAHSTKPIPLLNDQPQLASPKEPRLDRFGDPLPPGAVNRLGSIQLRHGGSVLGVVYMPDGKALASTCSDGFVRLWDAKTGKLHWSIAFDTGSVREPAIALSSDSKKMGVLTSNEFSLVATDTGKVLEEYHWPKTDDDALVIRVAIAPDLSTVARAFRDSSVRLYDPVNGKERLRLKVADNATPAAISFSADGKMVALAGFQTSETVVFDTADGKLLQTLKAPQGAVHQIAFSPDSKLLAAADSTGRQIGSQAGLIIWDLATGKQRHFVETRMFCCAFSPDSSLVALGGLDVVIHDTATGKEQRRILATPTVLALAFAPDGKTLAEADQFGCITLWEVATGKQVQPSAEPGGLLRTLQFQAGGKQLLSLGSNICWWDVASGELVRQVAQNWGMYGGQSVSANGKLWATIMADKDGKRNLSLVDTATEQSVRTLIGHAENTGVIDTVFSYDGTKFFSAGFAPGLPAGGLNPRIFVWDVATGNLLHQLQSHSVAVEKLAVSPDGCWLASSASDASSRGDYDIRLWDVGTGKLVHRLTPRRGSAFAIVFSADSSRLVSVGGDPGRTNDSGEVQIWDVLKGKEVRSFVGHQERVTCAALTADGRMLATGSIDKTLRFWEVATGLERRRIAGHQSPVEALDFSPDGRLLAAASIDAPILLWDAYSLEKPALGAGKLTKARGEALWQGLAAADGVAAFQAVCELIARPVEALTIVHEGWKLYPRTSPKQIEKWIQDMNSDQYAVRKKATTELEQAVTGHEELVQKALLKATNLEATQRLKNILNQPNPERLRRCRMLEVLEQVATPSARRLLQTLADQGEDSQLTTEAVAGLKRLEQR